VGDPDLSVGAQRAHPSLAALIGAGDLDAFAGFRDAHAAKVRSYCGEVCARERVEEALAAAFIDFLARLRIAGDHDSSLEKLLLAATRSAAAGRFEVWRSLAAVEQTGSEIHPDCAAMPELLAASANGELRGDRTTITRHLSSCPTCAITADRTQQAARRFAATPAGAT
jgi:hypothetical protein